MKGQGSNLSAQQRRENRKIVTPYAFEVSAELFGTPLATPTQRAVALLIDLILVGLLTLVNAFVLAGFAAWTFWRAGNKLTEKKRYGWGRRILRFFAALLIFAILFNIFESVFEQGSDEADGVDVEITSFEQGVMLAALWVQLGQTEELLSDAKANGKCSQALDCAKLLSDDLLGLAQEAALDQDKISEVKSHLLENLGAALSESDRQRLQAHIEQVLVNPSGTIPEEGNTPTSDTAVQTDQPSNLAEFTPESEPETQSYSLVEWGKGIIEDLGIGFGWAAFYFSVFTAWWHGQTPGKRLMGIKVIQLDGSGLNLWASFERYGGYGAGLATGLLGFLQIFWDPNRQAIHDKISETLVINLRLPKQQWAAEQQPAEPAAEQ